MQHKKHDRITYAPDGSHEHRLASIVRLYDADSTITRFIRWVKKGGNMIPSDEIPLVLDRQVLEVLPAKPSSPSSLESKYGRYKEVVGWGSSSTVKVTYKPSPHSGRKGHLYAVKAFRKRPKESDAAYQKRASSEFCIATTLQHKNVIHTLDLLSDHGGQMCQIMEFCAAGDLRSLLLSAGKLDEAEADCLYKQLLRGVMHCHQVGVVHRDLKPENVLLTTSGCLKISDFGTAECIRYHWEETCHLSTGLFGSRPYMAPEVYASKKFDARAVDVWATAIIYVTMRTTCLLWKQASIEDALFKDYVFSCEVAEGYRPIELLEGAHRRKVIYSMLHLNPGKRPTATQVIDSSWFKEISVCRAGDRGY